MRKKKSAEGNCTLDAFVKREHPTKPQELATMLKVPKDQKGPPPTIEFMKAPFLYPKNPEIREYQYSISRTCLLYNTLVCLPTGLGKTHIASVLILNYYRWFPAGKIFFLAPTRPLVYQQRNSLASYYDLIDEDSITDLNGEVPIPKRSKIYQQKRVFFMTPQTLDNDLQQGRLDAKQTVLVIFDEAHRAVGNYSYCNIVKQLDAGGMGYRLIGLSATPGNCLEKIQEVVSNLHAFRLESKDDNDPDVKKYTHDKEIIPIEIKANAMIVEVERLLDSFLQRPLNILIGLEVIGAYLVKTIKRQGISQGTYFQIFDGFRKGLAHYQSRLDKREIGLVYSCLRVIKLMADCKKALREQGYDSFQQFMLGFKDNQNERYKKIPFRKEILQSDQFQKLEKIFEKEQTASSHPKLLKLRELLVEYFSSKQSIAEQSKAIVFTGFKASALEIKTFLEEVKEVRSALFVGQSKTMATTTELVEDEESQQISVSSTVSVVQLNQKEQIATIKKFRNNEYNTLVSTSIGEEGLDIGEVDLIICYDSGMSPIRMVQRMGRTGRKRAGKVYLLLMEGKEVDKYAKASKESKSLQHNIRSNSRDSSASLNKSKSKRLAFDESNSSMLPEGLQLDIEYLDNKMVKKQQSAIKIPTKDLIKQTEDQQKLEEDDLQPTMSASQQPALSQASQNSDRMLDRLDAFEDSSLFESL